jgi:transposase
VLAAVERGTPSKEIARLFGISLPTIGRYVKRRRETGEVAPRPSPGRTPTVLATVEHKGALWKQLEDNDTATLERHCELWEEEQGVRVSLSTMSRAIGKLGWSRMEPKKRSMGSSERNEKARSAIRERVKLLNPRRLIFVDECGTNISLAPLYGWAPKESGPTGRLLGTGIRT